MVIEKMNNRYKVLTVIVVLTLIAFVILIGIARYILNHGGEGSFTKFLDATALLYNGTGYILHTLIFLTVAGLVFSMQKGRNELASGFKLSLIYLVILAMIYWVIVYFNI